MCGGTHRGGRTQGGVGEIGRIRRIGPMFGWLSIGVGCLGAVGGLRISFRRFLRDLPGPRKSGSGVEVMRSVAGRATYPKRRRAARTPTTWRSTGALMRDERYGELETVGFDAARWDSVALPRSEFFEGGFFGAPGEAPGGGEGVDVGGGFVFADADNSWESHCEA
jgi:hypothetical protein